MPLSLLPHTSTKEESDKPWALRQQHAATSMQQTLRGTAARGSGPTQAGFGTVAAAMTVTT